MNRENIYINGYHINLIHHMIKETSKTLFGLITLSLMFIWVFKDFLPLNILLLWTFLQTVFIFIRYFNAKKLKYYIEAKEYDNVKSQVRVFFYSIIFSAFVWNFGFMSSIIYSPDNYEFIAISLIMGILTAGTVSLSSMYKVFVVYFILMITPISIIMLYMGEHSHYGVLLFISIYIPTILMLAKSVNRSIVNYSKLNEELNIKVEELNKISVTDVLTGIYNRRYFFESSKKLIDLSKRENATVSLLMIDIDYFKKINDTYGHIAGDMVLVELCKEINKMTRTSDIFARIGGEEFTILLYNTNLTKAKLIAQNICDTISSKEFIFEDKSIDVTISIGVSQLCDEISTLDELYMSVDLRLYEAKNEGRNRVA